MSSFLAEDPSIFQNTLSPSSSLIQNNNITTTYDTLYNSLSYNLPEADLTMAQKTELTESINSKLDLERKEIIYALCLIDYSKFSPNTKVVFPYKCKQIRENALEIKLDSLPIRLKQILYKFIKF